MIKFAFIILLMNLSQMAWSVCGKPIKEKPSSYSKFNTTYSSFKDNPFKEFEKNKILICTCNVNRKYISEDGTEKEVSENHFLQVITTNEMNEHAISALDDRCAKLQASFNKGEEVPLKKKFEHSDDNIKKVEIYTNMSPKELMGIEAKESKGKDGGSKQQEIKNFLKDNLKANNEAKTSIVAKKNKEKVDSEGGTESEKRIAGNVNVKLDKKLILKDDIIQERAKFQDDRFSQKIENQKITIKEAEDEFLKKDQAYLVLEASVKEKYKESIELKDGKVSKKKLTGNEDEETKKKIIEYNKDVSKLENAGKQIDLAEKKHKEEENNLTELENRKKQKADKFAKKEDEYIDKLVKKEVKKENKDLARDLKKEIKAEIKEKNVALNNKKEAYEVNKDNSYESCRSKGGSKKDCRVQAENENQDLKTEIIGGESELDQLKKEKKDVKNLADGELSEETQQQVAAVRSDDHNTSGGDAELCKTNSDSNFSRLAQCSQPPPSAFTSSTQGMFSVGDLSTCKEEFGNEIFSNAEFWKQFEIQPNGNVLCAKIQDHYCEAEKIAYLSCDEKGQKPSQEFCPNTYRTVAQDSEHNLQEITKLEEEISKSDNDWKNTCIESADSGGEVCNANGVCAPSNCTERGENVDRLRNINNQKITKLKEGLNTTDDLKNQCITECKNIVSSLAKKETPHPQFNITQGLIACIHENKEKYHQEVYLPCKSAHAIAEINEYDDQAIQEAQAKSEKNSKKKNQQEEPDGETSISSFDGRFQCEKSAPYVADWKACKRMVQTYNAAFAAEQALNMTTEATQLVDQNRIQDSVQESMKKGDTQTAAMEAIRRTAKGKANVETARLAFYSTQAVVLGAELAAWPTPKNVSRKCEKCPECCEYMAHELKQYKDDIFPNLNTKHAFLAEMFTVLGKAGQAGIMMAEFNRQSKLMAQIKDKFAPKPTNDPGYDMQMTLCEFNPNDPQCQGAGPGGGASNFNGPGINFEFGAANNFDAQGGVIDSSNPNLGTPGSYQKDPVADTKVVPTGDLSGFKENFDAPSAVAAGFKPVDVGGAGGGGGAGGAGGGGGGAGARKPASTNNGPTEINTNKIDGKYSMGAGGASGYSAASSSKSNGKKDDKNASGGSGNPFEKLQGRIPASRDIGRADSSLFKKITDRYQDVLNARRVLVLE